MEMGFTYGTADTESDLGARTSPETCGAIMAWRTRAEHLQTNYSITEAQYEEILRNQKGVCAICRNHQRYKRLAVDHDHKTGQVRGLLCEQCNRGLGRFFDSPFRLRRAAEYLDSANAVWRKVMEAKQCQPQAQSVK